MMMGEPLFTVSVLLSVITGTMAGTLSLLTRETLSRSPFGQAVFTLSIAMVIFVLYHVTLLLFPGSPVVAQTFKSALFTGVTVSIWLLVWSQYRLRHGPTSEVNA